MKKNWYRLDNAALVFPAITYRKWSNAFRVSATLNEDVDKDILFQALNDLRKRFPTFFVKLCDGLFWHYLQENNSEIVPIIDYAYPLTHMSKRELRNNCIRVLYFKNRIAVEIYHAITDGNGGVLFLKNLVSHYLELKEKIEVSKTEGIKELDKEPPKEELEDAFLKTSGKYADPLKADNTYKLRGTIESRNFHHLILGILDSNELVNKAHEYGVSVTSFLGAVMIESIIRLQKSRVKENRQKPVNVTIPTNLRKVFGIDTIRNFILVVNVGVNPKDGEYTLKELCEQVHHQIKINNTKQKMHGEIAGHVLPAQNIFMKIVPLFIKDFFLKIAYAFVGERKGCINISNVGVIKMPEEIKDDIGRMEFIIGPQFYYHNNCSVLSYNGKTYINMIRSIKESELEQLFFSRLVELGLKCEIESNER